MFTVQLAKDRRSGVVKLTQASHIQLERQLAEPRRTSTTVSTSRVKKIVVSSYVVQNLIPLLQSMHRSGSVCPERKQD